ncbi:MAG: DUF1592 domain-containing protein [Deltaproteobacteria bacterium]|nr:DUF1592 domain-containing protein [Deltaproteobacteria bacterium]
MARVRAKQTLVVSLLGLVLGGCYSGVDGFDGPGAGGDPARVPPGDDAGQDDGNPEASCEEGPAVGASPLRRLTRFEYDNAVRDLLGDTTRPGEQLFSPDEHLGGFAANAVAPISKTQLDEYASAAEDLATTFVQSQLDQWIDCPVTDTACAAGFVDAFGRRAFRRPLETDEVDDYVALYEDANQAWDGETGLRLVVESMLMSPNFLYHLELMPEGTAETDVTPVSPYELAARTSFFVWASVPDDALLDAAAAGELDTPEGLETQVRRMLEDDRAADTLASFTGQWMHLEGIEDKVKDATLFPQWDLSMAESMQRETTAFVDEVVRNGDATLGTLLTARWTMADAPLAALYGVAGPDGEFGRVDLPPQERAGLLTQASFLTTNAHAAEVSWVYRGKFVRENLLCQHLPAPPIGVEVNEANDLGRLEDPECSGCHLMMDPIGWGFDDYDPLGIFVGEGQPGEVAGAPEVGEFDGVVQLAESLAASQTVQDCVATQWFRYAARREEQSADTCALDDIKATFAESGQDIRELIVAVVLSDAFRYRTAQQS